MNELQKIFNSFLWGSKKDESCGINWLAWDKLCVMKEHGGMGFKDFHAFDLAMLGKQDWKFLTNANTLVS